MKSLGGYIRKIRKEKGVTLIELSKRTGVAQATLSRIETGTMTGTIESHEKIAEALGLGLGDLYAGIDRRQSEITYRSQGARHPVMHQQEGVSIEILTQENWQKKMTPLRVTLSPGSRTETESLERGVEKFIYILAGQAKVKIDQKEYVMKKAETLYFDASLPHDIMNPSLTEPLQLLSSISPPRL